MNDAVDFYERMSRKIWVEASRSEWFLYANGFNASQAGLFIKRASDVICSAILLAVTAPITALVAIAITLDSKGPVLFRQERVGLHGMTFVVFKVPLDASGCQNRRPGRCGHACATIRESLAWARFCASSVWMKSRKR